MLFTSIPFLVFMIVVFLGYYWVRREYQWVWLLFVSYYFYGFASPRFLVFLLAVTSASWLGGLAMGRNQRKHRDFLAAHRAVLGKDERVALQQYLVRKNRKILVLALVATLSLLVATKYGTFLLNNLPMPGRGFGMKVSSLLGLALPIGLSFYTFQSMGYCLDVYWGSVESEANFFRYAAYVSYFPQILQGPIGTCADLLPQIMEGREFQYRNAVFGAQRIVWGIFKKLVIADQIAIIVNPIFSDFSGYFGLSIAFALVLYSFQLYADFSGYMDIALGCSEMLGIRLAENFDSPYFAPTIADFWRRWHISLGAWFKNYVFYPILRSDTCSRFRKRTKHVKSHVLDSLPTVLTLLVIWLLIGLWHGADWSYVAYGLYHGTFIMAGTLLSPLFASLRTRWPGLIESRPYKMFQALRTFAIVTMGYSIFRLGHLHSTRNLIAHLVYKVSLRGVFLVCYTNVRELLVSMFGITVLLIVDAYHLKPGSEGLRNRLSQAHPGVRWPVYVLALVAIGVLGAYGTGVSNQFAYFRF